jgi:hypothetical protein
MTMARISYGLGAGSSARTPDHRRRTRNQARRTSRRVRVRVRRRIGLLAAIGLVLGEGAYAAGGGGGSVTPPARAAVTDFTPARAAATWSFAARAAAAPHVVATPLAALTGNWTTLGVVHGQPAAWIAQRAGDTLMRFDQSLVHLDLHAGSSDGGVAGWTYGDQVTAQEIPQVLAGFNGGFKLTYGGGGTIGFMANGRVAVPLKPSLASIVTYTDRTTNIGAWHNGVPAARKTVFSVLQNQRLLVDRGVAAATVNRCVIHCWGVTIMNLRTVARSGLGITARGQLVWAAGEQLSPADLANALVSAGAVRAIELDINPHWVAAYLYAHHPTGLTAAPLVPGQQGVLGQFLAPYSRDFFVVVAN